MTGASAPEPASRAGVPPGYRFERKYRIEGAPLAEIEAWVRRCPARFRTPYPPRRVNNIYLDTHRLSHYFENLAGVAGRTKIRVRWYGDLQGTQQRPRLEFKIRRGMLGTKRICSLAPLEVRPGLGREDLRRLFQRSCLEDAVRRELAPVEPTLVNCYHRQYRISACGLYRITLDSRLDFLRFDPLGCSLAGRRSLEGSMVMELKYDGTIADLDRSLLNYFPFRVTRMSKYVTGIELTHLW